MTGVKTDMLRNIGKQSGESGIRIVLLDSEGAIRKVSQSDNQSCNLNGSTVSARDPQVCS